MEKSKGQYLLPGTTQLAGSHEVTPQLATTQLAGSQKATPT